MLASFSEFKFYQSFRIPVLEADDLRFLVQIEDENGKEIYIEDAKLVDLSVSGLGLSTKERIKVGEVLDISLQFRRHHLDLTGKIVRAFCNAETEDELIYGVELEDDKGLMKFIETFIMSFSTDRLRDCLIESALKERYTKASDGFEMFSLLLSLFKDITHFGDKQGFLENMLEEVVRILNAQRSSIFLINPETNELEAVSALGVSKETLKFDYRVGIAGSVFTTGVALNIDVIHDRSRFNESFDKKLGFETKSIICHPIHNREDKIIGVIEVLNKRNQDRFTVDDEKTMKVMALVFSSVFHNYNPISETSLIRRFSTPFDRRYAMIGKTAHVSAIRSSIIKTKDLAGPMLVYGETGVGKTLYARIIHNEGHRGLKEFETIDCSSANAENIEEELFGKESKLLKARGGTVFIREVSKLKPEFQKRLAQAFLQGHLEGSNVSIDARIIASTCEDLCPLVDNGEFDSDLYNFLMNTFVKIGPLRRRADDIPLLVDYFLRKECKDQGLLLKNFSTKAMEKLMGYDWPGNIEELRTCVKRAVLYNPKSHVITDEDLDSSALPLLDSNAKERMFGSIPHVSDYKVPLKDRLALVEKEMIMAEIKRHNGNKSQAAKSMGISREALRKKLIYSTKVTESLEHKGGKPKTSSEGQQEEACKEISDIPKAA